jgi:hypothetical protein
VVGHSLIDRAAITAARFNLFFFVIVVRLFVPFPLASGLERREVVVATIL